MATQHDEQPDRPGGLNPAALSVTDTARTLTRVGGRTRRHEGFPVVRVEDDVAHRPLAGDDEEPQRLTLQLD